ncbi:hypothetical protein TYRP_015327 [Tyrophagus putrescentiae]|nr:hypothetical protein TYRP_015327 [Tyrophagus putrescentiae]
MFHLHLHPHHPQQSSSITTFIRRLLLLTIILILLVTTLQPNVAQARTSLPLEIQLGAIFEAGDDHLRTALFEAVAQVNRDKILLPKTNLSVTAFTVEPRDSFSGAKLVCRLLQNNVWAIFSSRSEPLDWFVHTVANELQVPHLSVNWNFRSRFMFNVNHPAKENDANLASTTFSPNGGDGGFGSSGSPFYKENHYITNSDAAMFKWNLDNFQPSNRSKLINNAQQQLFNEEAQYQQYTLRLYPDANSLSRAFLDLIVTRNWKSFTMIYDRFDGLIAMKDLLRITAEVADRNVKVTVIAFPPEEAVTPLEERSSSSSYHELPNFKGSGGGGNSGNSGYNDVTYKKLLKNIKKSEHNFVLFLSAEKSLNFLREALRSNRMSEYDNFLIASVDFHLMDLREFQKQDVIANITGLSVLSSSPPDYLAQGKVHAYRSQYYGKQNRGGGENGEEAANSSSVPQIGTIEGLIHDAVTVFANTINELDRRLEPEDITEPYVSCDGVGGGGNSGGGGGGGGRSKWHFGATIMRHMKETKLEGLSGPIAFDRSGHRVNFTVDVLQLKPHAGLKNVATWTEQRGITAKGNYSFTDSYNQVLVAMRTKELVVLTSNAKNIPYVFFKPDHEKRVGNDKYDGYCIELLQKIAEVLEKNFNSSFKYTIRLPADGMGTGKDQGNGEWNGMIGELMRHQADLAISDLTATYAREQVVDFTMPFMNLGITILFKKTPNEEPELFSFLKPLSVEVWLYLGSAFLAVSIILWLMARISPYEWVSPHACDPEPLLLENQFSIGNSLWFTIGSLMQQGSDLAPRALSTRTLAAVWWFFTMIMISSYTANLAASLTLSRMAPAINNEVYIDDFEKATDRVRKGGYAYLAESSTIEYKKERVCDVYQVGNWLDNKGYGIATPSDSPYRTPISNAIVVLQDQGQLYQLKKKWWIEDGGGQCPESPPSSQELNIENVGGVFVVLVAGVVAGCFFGALEFIWKSLKVARHERDSIGKLIWLEVVRICTGGSSSRPCLPVPVELQHCPNNSSKSNLRWGANTVNSARPRLTKASSGTSIMNGLLSPPPPTSSSNFGDIYDARALSPGPGFTLPPPPPELPPHQQQYQLRQLPSFNSYDSTAPLLSPGGISGPPGSAFSRLNSGIGSNPKSPSLYSNMY